MKHNVLRGAALVSGMILASCGGAHAACLAGYDCGIVTGDGAGDTCYHFTLSDDLEGNNPREYAISEDVINDKSTLGKLKVIRKNQSLSLKPGNGVVCQNQLMPEAKGLHNPAKQQ